MADPVQARAKEKRLADALRVNLKRRKEQARERTASENDRDQPTAAKEVSDIASEPNRERG